MKKQLIAIAVSAGLSAFGTQSHAEWYIGIDGTNISYQVEYSNSNETYDLNPARLKLGYLADSGFGVEFQVLGSADDSTLDGTNVPFQTETKTSWGVSGIFSSTNETQGFYGTLGIMVLDTTYTDQTTNISDQDDVTLAGVGLGYYYHVSDKLKLTADYTAMGGEAAYRSFATQDVDVKLRGFGLGLSYIF